MKCQKCMSLLGITCVAAASTTAGAWEFRCRFIERIGSLDHVLPGNVIDASSGAVRSIRVQFGVFDDAERSAPAGGFVGWNVGSITVSGTADNSDERRNNGRISPFNFASATTSNGSPPAPSGDPFTMLTGIDATLGTQSPVWICDANGVAPPMPPATFRGRNAFVSVYAFSIDPRPGAVSYDVSFAGNLIAATEWLPVGTPTPPTCNPDDPSCDTFGGVTYAPFPTEPQAFSCSLNVLIPAPSGGVFALAGVGLSCLRQRRRGIQHRTGSGVHT